MRMLTKWVLAVGVVACTAAVAFAGAQVSGSPG
jgi:hypothetical protein